MKLFTHIIENKSGEHKPLIVCHGLTVLNYNLNRLFIEHAVKFNDTKTVMYFSSTVPDEHVSLYEELWADIKRQCELDWAENSITYTVSSYDVPSYSWSK